MAIDIPDCIPSPRAREKASIRMQKREAEESTDIYPSNLKKLCTRTEFSPAASDRVGRITSTGLRKNVDATELSRQTRSRPFKIPFKSPVVERSPEPQDDSEDAAEEGREHILPSSKDPDSSLKLPKPPPPPKSISKPTTEALIDPTSKYSTAVRRSLRSGAGRDKEEESALKKPPTAARKEETALEPKQSLKGLNLDQLFFFRGPRGRTYQSGSRSVLTAPFQVPSSVSSKRPTKQSQTTPRRDTRSRANLNLSSSPGVKQESPAPKAKLINPFASMTVPDAEQTTFEISTELAEFLSSKTDEATSIKKCPCCNEEVDARLMKRFFKSKKPTSATIDAFCKHHRFTSAEEEWAERGYPEIDWDTLDDRARQHYDHLRDVLKRETESVFRQRQEDAVSSGTTASLYRQMGTEEFDRLTPGYYGGRGADIMLDAITKDLAEEIVEAASSDSVVNNCSGGVAGYVQTVLVPELATQLVMEDLSISEEEALQVLVDSVAIGDLLHP